jgi:hypothetical protein
MFVNALRQRPGIDRVLLAQNMLVDFAKSRKMNALVVLMPESSWSTKSTNAYGSYEKLPQRQLNKRQPAEEPLSSAFPQSKELAIRNSSEYIRGVAPLCYNSLDSCIRSTNACSGHGECYKKRNGTEATAPCFACLCKPQFENVLVNKRNLTRTSYWGGGACQKEDISESFWLLATASVVLVGLVSWAIGAMFSIGEEKLPGVIGAGVSSKAG